MLFRVGAVWIGFRSLDFMRRFDGAGGAEERKEEVKDDFNVAIEG